MAAKDILRDSHALPTIEAVHGALIFRSFRRDETLMRYRFRQKRGWLLGMAVAIPAAIVLAAATIIGLTIRQESLDHELIGAIDRNDGRTALALLVAGADVNAHKSNTPPRTVLQILIDLLHGKRPAPPAQTEQSALVLAVEHDNTEVARALLERRCSGVNDYLTFTSNYGSLSQPLLHVAIRHGNFALAESLLNHGAAINPRDTNSSGAIIAAFYPLNDKDPVVAPSHWHETLEAVRKMVRMLVARGADICAQDEDGQNALDKAAADDDETLVEYLLAKGMPPNGGIGREGPLNYAIQSGNLKLARVLLHHGASIHTEAHEHEALVFDALDSQDPRILRFVIAHGADVNALKVHGKFMGLTALALAARVNDQKQVRLLFSLGADANVGAPLIEAAWDASPATLELLLAHGAKVNAQSRDGFTALMSASEEGNDEAIDCLLQHKAAPDQRNSFRQTALMLAAEDGNPAAVQDLLEAGAKVNLRDKDGKTALDYAAGKAPVIALLKRWGARSGKPR